MDFHLPVASSEVKHREELGLPQLIQQVIHTWQWEDIQLCHEIEVAIVDAEMQGAIFLVHQHHRTSPWAG